LGGMHSWLAAVADPRIAVVVPFIAVQGFRWALENNVWQERVATIQKVFEVAREDLGESVINSKVVEAVYGKINPGLLNILDSPSSLKAICPRPLLILNGELDPRCPKEGVLQAFNQAQEHYRSHGVPNEIGLHFAPQTGHAVTPEQFKLAIEWLTSKLQNNNKK